MLEVVAATPRPGRSAARLHSLIRHMTMDRRSPNSDHPRVCPRLGRSQRIQAAALACLLFGLLLTGRMLKPNPSGIGTHRQLGLPPCTFEAWFGMRCPTCGMTTSWAHFTRGSWGAAWGANPGGFFLAVASVIAACWAAIVATFGIYRPIVSQRTLVGLLVVVSATTLVDWVLRLF